MHESGYLSSSPTDIDSFWLLQNSPFFLRGDEDSPSTRGLSDLGELDFSPGNVFHHHVHDNHIAVSLSTSSAVYNDTKASNVSLVSGNNLQSGGFNTVTSMSTVDVGSSGGGTESGTFAMKQHKEVELMEGNTGDGSGILGNYHFDHSGINDHSQQTDTSTDSTDDRNQSRGVNRERSLAANSIDGSKGSVEDQKALRRLAQNREAARKSRMRKKAHVEQLENSRLRLATLEQELKRAREQGMFAASGCSQDQIHATNGNGALAFNIGYSRWLQEHQRLIQDLRSATNSHSGDSALLLHVDAVMSHYDEYFRLKSIGTKSDVFHMLSGMWKTPAERCFLWLGGFRSSEILNIIGNHIKPLTEEQLVSIGNLRCTSQEAEDALSQGMEALQQSLVQTLSSSYLGPRNSGIVAEYMGQMAIAMTKFAAFENFLHQADLLRQQTLQQLQRILSVQQFSHALLAINNYNSRLRALSSLWLARPKA